MASVWYWSRPRLRKLRKNNNKNKMLEVRKMWHVDVCFVAFWPGYPLQRAVSAAILFCTALQQPQLNSRGDLRATGKSFLILLPLIPISISILILVFIYFLNRPLYIFISLYIYAYLHIYIYIYIYTVMLTGTHKKKQ